MRRFFVDPDAIRGEIAVLTGPEAHHLSAVLRLAPGAAVTLFDGGGRTYEARISRVGKGRVEARILASAVEQVRSQPELHVGFALLKGKKMELIVQKATELGVASLHPFISRYCSNLGGAAPTTAERWQRIALEACKQCNRPMPPELAPVMNFASVLDAVKPAASDLARLIFWEEERSTPLGSLLTGGPLAGTVMILIGPEGGFSREEVEQARAAGYQPITLGRRILRAETATITAIAILQHLLGNLE